ncbi:MAG: phosphomannomutase/phosphoglucomutase [Bdellovibrionota bacterium]
MRETIFREYDIRGVVGTDFDAEVARRLGLAYAKLVRKQFPAVARPTVAVGYDCRLSGDELRRALSEGLVRGGVKVIDSGMGPTPQLYYATLSLKLQGGIQVTGSHNPGDQNGFKMMLGERTLSGGDIQALRKEILNPSGEAGEFDPEQIEPFDARTAYIAELIKLSLPHMGKERKLKLVVDGGNGVGGLVGPALLRGLGCEVVELYTEPDGRFPNHHPDPTVLENIEELRKRVVTEKADAGIAWDGDADRIGVVDERGEPIFGDLLLVLYGRQLLKEVPRPTIIGDVKCSEVMFDDLRARGANTVMAKTGHSLIKAKLKELHAELAGEMSGHMFFAHRYYGFDDALHASARLVEILSQTKQALSELLGDLPKMFNTPELRVDCPEDLKFKVAETAKASFPEYAVDTLDGVRIRFPHGWGLVRASNTQPVLVMRFEADSEARLAEYRTLVEDRIRRLQEAG